MGNLRISGRADLLRALADTCGRDPDAVSGDELARFASLLDWRALPAEGGGGVEALIGAEAGGEESGDQPGDEGDDHIIADPLPQPEPGRRPPLQARFFVVLESRELPMKEARATSRQLEPLTAADCGPLNTSEPPPIQPLVPRARLWPALRRSLSQTWAGRVDVPKLVSRLSRAESIRRLPRTSRCGTGGEVWIVIDIAQRLIPYEHDLVGVVDEVRRLHGVANVRLWLVSEVPDAVLSMQCGRSEAVAGRIPVPPAGIPILILGDLGLLSRDKAVGSQWNAFCRRMSAAGAHPVAWVPVSPQLVTRETARYARVHCLGAGDLRHVKPNRCAAQAQWPDEALHRLLVRIACCVRVEPALLRSLRLLSLETAAEPELEALVWAHPSDVRAGYRFCEIATPVLASYRAAFAGLEATTGGRSEQDEVLRRMLAWHAYRGRATGAMESLIWRTHAARLPDEFKLVVEGAGEWMSRAGLVADGVAGDVAGYARDLLARQGGDSRLMEIQSECLAPLWARSGQETIPAGLASADVAAARWSLNPKADARDYLLVQQGQRLFLEPRELRRKRELDGWASMPWPVVTINGGFEWSRSDGAIRRWFVPGLKPLELPLGDGPEGCTFSLASGGRQWDFGSVTRPSWAIEWGQGANGVYALAPSPVGPPRPLYWDPPSLLFFDRFHTKGSGFSAETIPIAPGVRMWADLEFGLVLDVHFGSALQRFRWIEPGEFSMGSPKGEAVRFGDEGPRHLVRLTEGFWLAETACSQSVWSLVMGGNPSKFKGDPQNPVEQVSWHAVQDFLREVEKRLPGVKADLPTEAEWEYACRAGSETAFSWGDGITPEQANYDAKSRYANGPTGEWRQKTVPVKNYAPNAWGLYQMHGNVLEWCADGERRYDGAPQADPRGPEGSAPRAARGGSWRDHPYRLRAAYRDHRHRVGGYDDQGFRFSLRSTSGPEHSPEASVAPEDLLAPLNAHELSRFFDEKQRAGNGSVGVQSGEPSRSSNVDRGRMLERMSRMLVVGKGPVPWSALRETIPVAKKPKPKRGGKR